jgi:hypothetical protein
MQGGAEAEVDISCALPILHEVTVETELDVGGGVIKSWATVRAISKSASAFLAKGGPASSMDTGVVSICIQVIV